MEGTTKTSHPKKDAALWVVIVLLATAGIFANYMFGELTWSLRFISGVVLVGCLFGLSLLTSQGKRFWTFIKAAKIELYKVVWPSRDETFKTTGVVAALVFVMSLILRGIDTVLFKLVGWLTS